MPIQRMLVMYSDPHHALQWTPHPFLMEAWKTCNRLEIDADTLVQWNAPSMLI